MRRGRRSGSSASAASPMPAAISSARARGCDHVVLAVRDERRYGDARRASACNRRSTSRASKRRNEVDRLARHLLDRLGHALRAASPACAARRSPKTAHARRLALPPRDRLGNRARHRDNAQSFRASPSRRCGDGPLRQSSNATTPPRLQPTSVNRSTPSASATASTSSAKPARVIDAGSGSGLLAPLPRSSMARRDARRRSLELVIPNRRRRTDAVHEDQRRLFAPRRARTGPDDRGARRFRSCRLPFARDERAHLFERLRVEHVAFVRPARRACPTANSIAAKSPGAMRVAVERERHAERLGLARERRGKIEPRGLPVDLERGSGARGRREDRVVVELVARRSLEAAARSDGR